MIDTAKWPAAEITVCIIAECATEHCTSGGSIDTELKEFAVIPWICLPPTVSTMTPVANCDITSRSVVGARSDTARAKGAGFEPAAAWWEIRALFDIYSSRRFGVRELYRAETWIGRSANISNLAGKMVIGR